MDLNRIIQGSCEEVMRDFPDNFFDTIITDIPYGIGFMGKDWDTFSEAKATHKEGHYITKAADGSPVRHQKGFSAASAAGLYDHSRNAEYQQWCYVWTKEALRVAKPGCIMLIFGGTRTYHRLTCAVEDAGWQIRDCMMWIYGSGFPKSHNISKGIDKARGADRKIIGNTGRNPKRFIKFKEQDGCKRNPTNENITAPATDLAKLWDGWGTALKPAWEPILVAMKPLDGTFAQNAEKWGVAGLNIDGGRISVSEQDPNHRPNPSLSNQGKNSMFGSGGHSGDTLNPQGRWPANLILDEESARLLDEQSGETSKGAFPKKHGSSMFVNPEQRPQRIEMADSGGASRFFYTAKESRKNRNLGLDGTLTVKYNIPKDIIGKDILCKDVSTVAVQLLKRVMSESTVKWLTGESGESITGLCHRDYLSTILTETKRIIESKILVLLPHCGTNGITLDAKKSTENGGSPAENAATLKKWILTITNGKTELVRGASRVASEMLLKTSVKENWQQLTNFHPTVKSLKLMEYLCNLTKTPTGGVVLDCFAGSGTTGMACINTGRDYILIEKEPEYIEIAKKRIKAVAEQKQGQMALFEKG